MGRAGWYLSPPVRAEQGGNLEKDPFNSQSDKLMLSYIYLKDLRFFARHGVARQEQLVGNTFVVNLRVQADFSRAVLTDEVSDTISYADLYTAIKAEMAVPSRLLEHVAGRIVRRLFADFPGIEGIELSLSKRNPPMGADIETAGIEIHAER